MSAHAIVRGEVVSGNVFDLARLLTATAPERGPASVPARVTLGDERIGWICKERRKRKGRACWRWVGYLGSGAAFSDAVELPDSRGTDRAACARAVAMAHLMRSLLEDSRR
jgi:hypothetical protein